MNVTRISAISLAVIVLVGCQTITPPSVYCDAARPITYSRTDTPETRQQVEQHNAVWTELCGG
jgi:hypothetical protein